MKDQIPRKSCFYKSRKKACFLRSYDRGVSRIHNYDRREISFYSQGKNQNDGFGTIKKELFKKQIFSELRRCAGKD
jgi:hypothetical protein